MIDLALIDVQGWVMKAQAPTSGNGSRLLALLHGWTGDENVMWIFTRHLPPDYWMIAPRGPVKSNPAGYGWAPVEDSSAASIADYESVIRRLLAAIDEFCRTRQVAESRIDLMGFSQGASLAYAFALGHPQRVRKIACLAGSLPGGSSPEEIALALQGKEIFIAHGVDDERVPVSKARESVRLLTSAGARVTYCETAGGHKLSLDCLHKMEAFFWEKNTSG